MKIIIIGAGVMGITTALKAIESGHEVILIDKNEHVANETSAQNGAQLSYSHAIAFNRFANFNNLYNAIFKADKPIKINLLELLLKVKWFFKLYRSRINIKNSALLEQYFAFAQLSREEFTKIKEKIPSLQILNSGSIHLFNNKDSYTEFLEIIKKQKDLQYEILERNNIKLKNIAGDFYKGIFFCCDQACDTKDFAAKAISYLQKNSNFTLLNNFTIEKINIKKSSISEITSPYNENITGDHFILSTGAFSKNFFKKLKIKSPLIEIKGYSLNIPGEDLQYSLIDHDNRMVYTKLNKNIRAAGLYDFSGFNKILSSKRKSLFLKYLQEINLAHDTASKNIWVGLRNATYDGVPAIGRSKKIKNLSYNIGHANLGWTLSAASAKLLIDDLDDKDNHDFEIFKANRFNI